MNSNTRFWLIVAAIIVLSVTFYGMHKTGFFAEPQQEQPSSPPATEESAPSIEDTAPLVSDSCDTTKTTP